MRAARVHPWELPKERYSTRDGILSRFALRPVCVPGRSRYLITAVNRPGAYKNPARTSKSDTGRSPRRNGPGPQQMHDSRDFGAMPILADALQGAGCDEILNHCRGPGPHARGCGVVDLVLGKEGTTAVDLRPGAG